MTEIEEFIKHKSTVIRGLERKADEYLMDLVECSMSINNDVEERIFFYYEQVIWLLIRACKYKHELKIGLKNHESKRIR